MLSIAHGGGGLDGQPYTNSVEAMDASYARGFRWFELDFKRTADGAVGCRHDWKDFGGAAPTLGELRAAFAGRFMPMDADGLAAWMAAHHDATLVTDVKEDDQVPVLSDLLAAGVPAGRTVVQLFDPSEDERVRAAGFERRSIILYRYGGGEERLSRFLEEGGVEAVGVSDAEAAAGRLDRLPGVPGWVYTVNGADRARALAARGVSAIFSDDLAPGEAGLTASPQVRLFVYGTLMDASVQSAVLGRAVPGEADALDGFASGWLTQGGERYPAVRREAGARTNGLVLSLTPDELAAADAYEGEGYHRRPVRLASGLDAFVYEAS